MNNNGSFSYSYSARDRAELKKIREKYSSGSGPEESKLERIRRLDASVHSKAVSASLALGIISALVMGAGMSIVMTDIGVHFGALCLPIGIGTGLAGIIGVIFAHPLYQAVTARERKRIAPEILRLTDELMEE